MKKFKHMYKGLVFSLGCGLLTTVAHGQTLDKPVVNYEQVQVTSNKADLTLGISDINKEWVAIELSIIADDIKEVATIINHVPNSYVTSKVQTLSDGKENLTCYIVSKDKDQPIALSKEMLEISLASNGTLKVEESSMYMKVIEKGYNVAAYTDIIVKGEIQDNNSSNGDASDDDNSSDNGSSNGGSSNGGSSNSGSSSSQGGNSSSNGTTQENKPSDDEVTDNEVVPTIGFTDIDTHWAKNAITNMAQKEIIKGYVDGSFKPNASITRAEFATLLARAFEIETTETTAPFKDVTLNKWYASPISAIYGAGITSGLPDGTFGVNKLITNEEISTLLYRCLEVKGIKLSTSEKGAFADENAISAYAKEAVLALQAMNIVQGKPNGQFGPKETTTRAQVAVLLDRILTEMNNK